MPKKFLTIFFSVFLLGLFLPPNLALADSSLKMQLFTEVNPPNGVYDSNKGETAEPAKEYFYEGFVPCGVDLCSIPWNNGNCEGTGLGGVTAEKIPAEKNYCQLCHGFVMANNLINYLVIKIVPILAVLMLVVGGVMLYFGGASPGMLSRSKTLMKGIVIGLFLIYGAYIIINTFLWVLGAAEIHSVKQIFSNGVFSIKCPVYIPK